MFKNDLKLLGGLVLVFHSGACLGLRAWFDLLRLSLLQMARVYTSLLWEGGNLF